jgi:hypothetical protein
LYATALLDLGLCLPLFAEYEEQTGRKTAAEVLQAVAVAKAAQAMAAVQWEAPLTGVSAGVSAWVNCVLVWPWTSLHLGSRITSPGCITSSTDGITSDMHPALQDKLEKLKRVAERYSGQWSNWIQLGKEEEEKKQQIYEQTKRDKRPNNEKYAAWEELEALKERREHEKDHCAACFKISQALQRVGDMGEEDDDRQAAFDSAKKAIRKALDNDLGEEHILLYVLFKRCHDFFTTGLFDDSPLTEVLGGEPTDVEEGLSFLSRLAKSFGMGKRIWASRQASCHSSGLVTCLLPA